MGRYTKQELDEIKRSVDLVALIQSKGIVLEKHGKDHLKGRCPFHDDNEPSLIVTPGKNLWNCPACQTGGDVIKFVELHDGVSFRHAVELLRADAGAVMGGDKLKRTTVPKLKPPVELDADDQLQLRRVVDYYHNRLLETQPAQDYLKKRGIFDPEAIKTFKLGYADRTLGLRLPDKKRVGGKAMREQLQKIGILRDSGHEHLNGCLVIPIFETTGGSLKSDYVTVSEVYGRKLDDSNKKRGYASHLYLPGPHKGVWNPACLNGKAVILAESLVDALTFWVHGLRNVTASYGTGGFTSDHLAAFVDRRIETVFIAYDRDDAGDNAAKSLAAKLAAEGIRCRRVQFPRGADANGFALSVENPADRLRLLIESAPWMQDIQGSAPHASHSQPLTSQGRSGTHSASPGKESATPCTPQTKIPQCGAESSDAGKPSSEAPAEPVPATASQAPAPQDGQPGGEVAGSPIETPSKPATSPPNDTSQENTGGSGENFPRPPEASSSKVNVPCSIEGEDIMLTLGTRSYRVRGLTRNSSFDVMKVNVRLSVGDYCYFDTLDLYNARHRKAFLHAAADECKVEADIVRRDVGRVLLKLEELQENHLAEVAEPERPAAVELDEAETKEALELLRNPQLLDRIAADFELAGLVGEGPNALVAYLAAVSRKTDDPLAVIIQSSSSAGKSSVMDAVLSLMPDEEQIRYTAMTGQSLFYMGETELAHKILAISEEEGAEQAGYALKILQSEKKLRIASTGKDAKTGRLVTQEYFVEGPCVIFMTTTSIEVDEELQNRCVVLTVNENREQTRRIHELQRSARTLAGLLRGEEKKRVLRVHQNAQRLLRPLLVVNPYAEQLTFADGRLRTRRDHMKYLNLINAVTLLHQYQREVKTVKHKGQSLQYVEATLADIEAANHLAAAVMGTSLDDLPPQTRKLLLSVHALACERCAADDVELDDLLLTRREIREYSGWSDTQLRVHLMRLVEMEYLAFHRAGPGGRFLYEVLYRGEGQDGNRFCMNLAAPEQLRSSHRLASPKLGEGGYDDKVAGQKRELAGRSRGDSGQVAEPENLAKSADLASKTPKTPPEVAESAKNANQDAKTLAAPRRTDTEQRAAS